MGRSIRLHRLLPSFSLLLPVHLCSDWWITCMPSASLEGHRPQPCFSDQPTSDISVNPSSFPPSAAAFPLPPSLPFLLYVSSSPCFPIPLLGCYFSECLYVCVFKRGRGCASQFVCVCVHASEGLTLSEPLLALYVCVVERWGTEEVGVWLEQLSLGEYRDTFTRHDIRGSELLHLERRDLKVHTHTHTQTSQRHTLTHTHTQT